MDKLLTKDVNKGKITAQQASEARERVKVVGQDQGMKAMRDVDMVIEVSVHCSASIQLTDSVKGRLRKPAVETKHFPRAIH